MTVEWKDMMLDKVAIGPVSARIYQGADYGKGPPIVLYLHGGAFLDSDKNVDRPVAMSLAKAGAIVVAADYSSLSGNLFPQALEVSFSVFTYLANKRAGLGDRKSLLFVAGEEAGGNVAAGVALKARDQMPDALDGQILISPLLDPFMGTSSIRKAEAIGMRQRWTEGWSHYLSGGGCRHLCGALPLFSYFGRRAGVDIHCRGRSSARRDNWLRCPPETGRRRCAPACPSRRDGLALDLWWEIRRSARLAGKRQPPFRKLPSGRKRSTAIALKKT